MTSALSRPRKTIEDFLACGEQLVELLDGEIYDRVPTDVPHQRTVGNLFYWLGARCRDPRFGRTVMSPLDVYLPSGDIVVPDLFFLRPDRRGLVHEDGVHGAPDLLVEVVREGHAERDRIVKRDLYARNGVPEYWIIDPADVSVEVFRLNGGAYRPAGYFVRPATLTTPILPGLSLSLDELFARQ